MFYPQTQNEEERWFCYMMCTNQLQSALRDVGTVLIPLVLVVGQYDFEECRTDEGEASCHGRRKPNFVPLQVDEEDCGDAEARILPGPAFFSRRASIYVSQLFLLRE